MKSTGCEAAAVCICTQFCLFAMIANMLPYMRLQLMTRMIMMAMVTTMTSRAVIDFYPIALILTPVANCYFNERIVLTTGQFTRNIEDPSSILSHNKCCGLWSALTALPMMEVIYSS